jgi:RNA polymerase sigma-70 factor (ECF subfamily)
MPFFRTHTSIPFDELVLKIWEGMTFAEIAEVLGESPNTAASRYRYALQKLSQHLQPLAEEGTYV